MKYSGTIAIYDDMGNTVLEKEMTMDEMLDAVLQNTSNNVEVAEEPEPKPVTKGTKVCRTCGVAGHMAKTCPKRIPETTPLPNKTPDEREMLNLSAPSEKTDRIRAMLLEGADDEEIAFEVNTSTLVVHTIRRQMHSRGELDD